MRFYIITEFILKALETGKTAGKNSGRPGENALGAGLEGRGGDTSCPLSPLRVKQLCLGTQLIHIRDIISILYQSLLNYKTQGEMRKFGLCITLSTKHRLYTSNQLKFKESSMLLESDEDDLIQLPLSENVRMERQLHYLTEILNPPTKPSIPGRALRKLLCIPGRQLSLEAQAVSHPVKYTSRTVSKDWIS